MTQFILLDVTLVAVDTPQSSLFVQAQTFLENKYFRLEPGMSVLLCGDSDGASSQCWWLVGDPEVQPPITQGRFCW